MITIEAIRAEGMKRISRKAQEAFMAGALDTMSAMEAGGGGLHPGDYPGYRRDYIAGSDWIIDTKNEEITNATGTDG